VLGLVVAVLAIGCGSEAAAPVPKNAGAVQQVVPTAASRLGPSSSDLKPLDGSSMQGLPAGLKPFGEDTPEPAAPVGEALAAPDAPPGVGAEAGLELEPDKAGLKAMTGLEDRSLPAELKAFPPDPLSDHDPSRM
jgi:hypothetical protein